MSELLQKNNISSEELITLLKDREEGNADFLLVDVREQMEYDAGHIKGVDVLKPTSIFQSWGEAFFNEIQDKTVIFTCRTGARSGQVAQLFQQNGHTTSINHVGGLMGYRGETER